MDKSIKDSNQNKKAVAKHYKYTIEQKIKIVNEIEKSSINAINKKYGIDKKCLRDWRDNKDKLLATSNKRNKYRLGHSGVKPIAYEFEETILNWINHSRLLGIGITIKSVIAYTITLCPSLKEKSYLQLYKWFQRFKKRNNISIRRATHLGQKLKQTAVEEIYRYFHYIIVNRRLLNIYEQDVKLIINCDETPVFLESPENTTISFKGAKEININTYANDKKRVSVILAIACNGYKLTPLFIFKGKPGKKLETKLNKIELCKKKKIFIKCQPNSWCDKEIFIFWVKNIFQYYEKFVVKKICLLIMDLAPSHKDVAVLDYMKSNDIHYIFLPPGTTRYLQPLDVGVNKLFKEKLKEKYLIYQLQNKQAIIKNNFKVPKEMVINWINDIWYSNYDIPQTAITNACYKCTLTYSMDGSNDEEFKFPDELQSYDLLAEPHDNGNNSDEESSDDKDDNINNTDEIFEKINNDYINMNKEDSEEDEKEIE